jgi:hypothetical protein
VRRFREKKEKGREERKRRRRKKKRERQGKTEGYTQTGCHHPPSATRPPTSRPLDLDTGRS